MSLNHPDDRCPTCDAPTFDACVCIGGPPSLRSLWNTHARREAERRGISKAEFEAEYWADVEARVRKGTL